MYIFSLRKRKIIALFFAFIILGESTFPIRALALTSGPDSPEFSGFTPVNSNNLVDTFTGSFSYNLPVLSVPGPDGGGYQLSLGYNSNISAEQEASWVGFGWTLNPGSISRSTNGFPDDYNQVNVEYYNKTIPNFTLSAKEDCRLENFGIDDVGFSLANTIRYNNYSGMSRIVGFGIDSKGIGIGLNFDGSNTTYNASLNPLALLDRSSGDDKSQKTERLKGDFWKESAKQTLTKAATSFRSAYSFYTMPALPRPQIFKPTSGSVHNWSSSLEINSVFPVGIEGGFSVTFSRYLTERRFNNTVSGYLYPSASEKTVNDYIVEKNNTFTERTTNLGLPFNAADQFMATGEGVTGGFRIFHNQDMKYHLNYSVDQNVGISNIGTEFAVGPNVGIGIDIGTGSQTTYSLPWKNYKPQQIQNEAFFSFNNDMAGMIDFEPDHTGALNTDVESAFLTLDHECNPVSDPNYIPNFQSRAVVESKIGHSSFIKNTTVGKSEKLNKRKSIDDLTYKPDPKYSSLIDQFSIVTEQGEEYLYGLPVYTENEVNLQVDVDNNSYLKNKTPNENILNNYLITKDIDESLLLSDPDGFLSTNSIVIGEKNSAPYATTFLLTQITTPDYIDVDDNGPSELDFGGWTKFDYKKLYSIGNHNGYHWRMPYSGLLYHKNELSNKLDDIGNLQMGDKEVFYLKAIETKTHIAFFITNLSTQSDFDEYFSEGNEPPDNYLKGSGKLRFDGLDANIAASKELTAKGSKRTQMLEKIILYSKSDFSKPIQTTYFEYDNSLVKNLPNSDAPSASQSGKLTLKRVWTESDGVIKSKISPYIFKYEYRALYPAEIASTYANITSYGANIPEAIQNPDYSPYAISSWGSLQYDGLKRFNNMQDFLYQGVIPENSFDPGAWLLKCIQLPSGGEIQVQYEENNYCFVQDKRAMSLVSLLNVNNNPYVIGNYDDYDRSEYCINLSDLGVNLTFSEKEAYVNQLKDYFLGKLNDDGDDEKIFFKFLYKLKGSHPATNDLKSEYISGYASVSDITLNPDQNIVIKLSPKDKENNLSTPRQTCYEFVINKLGHKLDHSNNLTYYDRDEHLTSYTEPTKPELVDAFGKFVLDQFTFMGRGPYYVWPLKRDIGTQVEKSLSYFKLPLPNLVSGKMKAKRAGGARVKRILMYDPGIENGSSVLYGSEYIYQLEDGSSSGVATNEPLAAKDDHSLVTFLPIEKQRLISKLISGIDRSQFEGPIGESILPSPSIGYSRVITENIYKHSTGSGFNIVEYYTVKDFPYDKDYNTDQILGSGSDQTNLNDIGRYSVKNRFKFNIGLFSTYIDKVWACQGYRFIINDLHGKTKSNKTYSETYNGGYDLNRKLISGEEYDYYYPGENITVWDGQKLIPDFYPGKQVEITSEYRTIRDEATDLNLEFDISLTLQWLPLVFATLIPQYNYKNVQFNSFATSKVIKYPAILKKVRSFNNGNLSESENLVFSRHTGQVLLTRSFDGFNNLDLPNDPSHNGSIFSLTVPASYVYDQMGPLSNSLENYNKLKDVAGQFVTYAENPLESSSALPTVELKNLISANVSTYSNNWYDEGSTVYNDYNLNSLNNSALEKLQSVFRKEKSYVCKIANLKSANSGGKIYNSGFNENSINMFNWNLPSNDWIALSEVTEYSPHGEAVEEKDALNIYSTVKYGYFGAEGKNRILPSVIVHNAKYSQVTFRDFENEIMGSMNSTSIAHSGNKAFKLRHSEILKVVTLDENAFNQELTTDGAMLKLWAFCPDKTIPSLTLYSNDFIIPLRKVAQSGEWCLFESKISGDLFENCNEKDIYILNQNSECNIDDLVFYPNEAEVTCFVYDTKSQRLLTKFPSSHFGLYYGYNLEGKLVRTIVETERGFKTIKETQYNLPSENRHASK